MTGPEHFRKAEELLASTPGAKIYGDPMWNPPTRENVTLAQVHAILALAAATALNEADRAWPGLGYEAWHKVAGVPQSDGEA